MFTLINDFRLEIYHNILFYSLLNLGLRKGEEKGDDKGEAKGGKGRPKGAKLSHLLVYPATV